MKELTYRLTEYLSMRFDEFMMFEDDYAFIIEFDYRFYLFRLPPELDELDFYVRNSYTNRSLGKSLKLSSTY
jgi:hypothetical protein